MYHDGKVVLIDDVVKIHQDGSSKGVVKGILHKGEYSESICKNTWEQLNIGGYLIDTEFGLILYEELNEDISLIHRGIIIH